MHEHILHIPCVWLQSLTAVASLVTGMLVTGIPMWFTFLRFESHWHKSATDPQPQEESR